MDKVHRSAVNSLAHIFAYHESRVMQAPLTIIVNSPLELVQQFFVKLGARYVVVTDANGNCELFSLFVCSMDRKSHFIIFEQFTR